MKKEDVKEFEVGEHCFGGILRVNGENYEDLTREDIMEFVMYMLEKDVNSEDMLKETFKNFLDYLQYDCVEQDNSTCEQCGNWNSYYKYKIEKQ